MISYKNFEFKRLFTLKTNDIKPNEYTAVWEWMIEELEISESFSLLRQLEKRSFSDIEIESFYSSNRQDYPYIDLKKILKALFDFRVIGNVWNYRGKACFSWKYRENTTIDYNKNFSIHMGLMKELNIL